jgi:hypothetical protein
MGLNRYFTNYTTIPCHPVLSNKSGFFFKIVVVILFQSAIMIPYFHTSPAFGYYIISTLGIAHSRDSKLLRREASSRPSSNNCKGQWRQSGFAIHPLIFIPRPLIHKQLNRRKIVATTTIQPLPGDYYQ